MSHGKLTIVKVSKYVAIGLLLSMLTGNSVLTRTLPDTVEVPGMIVSASRIPLAENALPAAATIWHLTESDRLETGSPADLLSHIPGVRAYSAGNLWGNYHMDTRGFYGAGQAQYSLVTLDGIPLNRASSGLTNWNVLDISAVDRIESVRGPSSSEFGDYAFGGILSLTTHGSTTAERSLVSLTSASDNAYAGSAIFTRDLAGFTTNLSISSRKNDGWREHNQLERHQTSLSFNKTTSKHRITGLVAFGRNTENTPGALTESELAQDRTAAATDIMGNPSIDRTEGNQLVAGLHSETVINSNWSWSNRIYLNRSNDDDIRTFTTAMDHVAELTTTGLESSMQWTNNGYGPDFKAVVGAALELSSLKSSYTESGTKLLVKQGDADRVFVSAYTQGIYYPHPDFYLSLGARLENLENSHKPTIAEEQVTDGEIKENNSSLYPRVSAGFSPNSHVTVYVSAARTFKAPTLIHLYDAAPIRNINPMIPIDWIDISNATIDPMTGTHLEVGAKFFDIGGIQGNVSIYSYYLKNEIDFDNATFSYQNIGKSQHSGAELSATKELPNNLNAGFDLSYNKATFEDGAFQGNQLNGVPRFTYSASLCWTYQEILKLNLRGNGMSDMWVDQENISPINNWFAVTLSGCAAYRKTSFHLTINNLFDREYEYNGYLDPLVQQARYYPAAGRNFMLSLAVSII